jgi:hypothetical protein
VSFDLGALAPLRATVRDADGTLANAGNMALTITLPDASAVTVATVAPASTGQYAYDYQTVQAGRHSVRWLATGANPTAYTDMFDVREATPPVLMSLAEAKKHLKKNDTSDDDEIRDWIEACTRAVEFFVGPVVMRTVVETADLRSATSVALQQIPAMALTSVVAVRTGGPSYDVDDLDLDPATGIVTRKDGGLLYGPLRFTYTAGRAVVGANIRSAAKIILQHLWRTRQGPGRPQLGTQDFDVNEPIPGLGYAIPNRAVQLLDPDRLPPAVG